MSVCDVCGKPAYRGIGGATCFECLKEIIVNSAAPYMDECEICGGDIESNDMEDGLCQGCRDDENESEEEDE